MRLIIDMQGAQSNASSQRGIGRYTLALCREMIRLRGTHEVILAVNGLLHQGVQRVREFATPLLPTENVHIWSGIAPTNALDPADDARRHANEAIREAFLASLRPDAVLLSSLFEGGADEVTSIGRFAPHLRTAVVLYDLIPLIHRKLYLADQRAERTYLNKLDSLRRANLLLSISASSAREAIEHLCFDPDEVVNISTACAEHFRPLLLSEATRVRVCMRYGIRRPFVMYTGGIDHRKNIDRLIRAFARLPLECLESHQLVIVCAAGVSDRERLQNVAAAAGLQPSTLVLTGYVPEDDLLVLYNSSKLFVFPSWHEGFGLPALEAMACGRPVIGSAISSIPEVIGLGEALFDPFDESAIASKMAEALVSDEFRARLEQHSLLQAKEFSWERSARRAWRAIERLVETTKGSTTVQTTNAAGPRLRLAFVSPLPPARSGISDYSAELLPELTRYYDVDVIVSDTNVADAWVRANCPVREVSWFRQNAVRYDRVLYHFGNSEFHSHMFELLSETPGVVVLHDFFLSGIASYMEALGIRPNAWTRALYHSHGWPALVARYEAKLPSDVVWAYPCNLEVLQQTLGIIVHSKHACRLANQWYGSDASTDWTVIPLLRAAPSETNRTAARSKLGLREDDFIVCSFGMLGPHKLSDRLIAAWLGSALAHDPTSRLFMVGENDAGDYGTGLVHTLRQHVASSRIEITGWVSSEVYRTWLAAADVGVQLRALSRGETSAAVLDCMNYGLATIVNANGSMADLPSDAVWMLADEFSTDDLATALGMLRHDKNRRESMGWTAREAIRTVHQPRRCAEDYVHAIERYYSRSVETLSGLMRQFSDVDPQLSTGDWIGLASALEYNFPVHPRRKQLLLDVSELAQRDAKTGIQRVVRAVLTELLRNPPDTWAVEPVYATGDSHGYRYARRFATEFLGGDPEWAEDEPVVPRAGDVFVGLDFQPLIVPLKGDHLREWRRRGVKIIFVVYDLLPLLLSTAFGDGVAAAYQRWLETISQFDGAVCISRAVLDELHGWLQAYGQARTEPFKLSWFHLGADVQASVPTRGLPNDAEQVLSALATRTSFLMVGTLEPRKAYMQVVSAFEELWSCGLDVGLVIVGKRGWMVDDLIERLSRHPELGNRLFWLEGISDEYLGKVYQASSCVIAASHGEGFGLPLIEGAEHDRPIIARDIPVFREVAGDNAFYFKNDLTPTVIADAVKTWMALFRERSHPSPRGILRLTWQDSARALLGAVMEDTPFKEWSPDEIRRFWGNDFRLQTQVGKRSGRDMMATGRAGFLLYGPYLSLSPDTYRITFRGTATLLTGAEWIDVVCEGGNVRLAQAPIRARPLGPWNEAIEFDLCDPVSDLEFRLWVDEATSLSVEDIELVASNSLNEARRMGAADRARNLAPVTERSSAEIERTLSDPISARAGALR